MGGYGEGGVCFQAWTTARGDTPTGWALLLSGIVFHYGNCCWLFRAGEVDRTIGVFSRGNK